MFSGTQYNLCKVTYLATVWTVKYFCCCPAFLRAVTGDVKWHGIGHGFICVQSCWLCAVTYGKATQCGLCRVR